jgi:light-regulated signal transduction histidine kinase (bacteriophytochrome)
MAETKAAGQQLKVTILKKLHGICPLDNRAGKKYRAKEPFKYTAAFNFLYFNGIQYTSGGVVNENHQNDFVVHRLLTLSLANRGEMRRETVIMSAIAQEIATKLQQTNPDRQAEFIIRRDLKTTGDSQMLRVLLENLLGNTWKFTREFTQACIEFGVNEKEGKITFFARDNGDGFDMAFVDKLFGAFQRLHDSNDFPGTGIGLATVQRIINRHGGWIGAEGTVGQGTTFSFSL